jgi:hypothetical protein
VKHSAPPGRTVPAELRVAARAIDLCWRGRRVDLLAIDEAAETAWVIEIDSGFAHTVTVADLTWTPFSQARAMYVGSHRHAPVVPGENESLSRR